MLVGQAKKDFEKWVSKNVKHYTVKKPKFGVKTMEFEFNSEFYVLPPSMQYGVIVDWFDSVGIDIYFHCDETLIIFDNGEPVDLPFIQYETRHQARQEAINKAVEIYNERF